MSNFNLNIESIMKTILNHTQSGEIKKETAIELLTEIKSLKESEKKPKVAIVGMAGRFPEADDVEQFWENLSHGRESIREFPIERKRNVEKYIPIFSKTESERLRIAGYLEEIDKFDYEYFGISPKEAELMDPNQRILLENVIHAIEDSGTRIDSLYESDCGVYVGYSVDFGTEYKQLINVASTLDAFAATGNTYSVLAGRISYLLGLQGPAIVMDTACSSTLVALNKAVDDIQNNACSQAIVGSVKVVPILGLTSELEFGVGSSTERTYPFDNRSDGIAFGEGVGTVYLKRLDLAIKDNDRIYGVIEGGSVNQDGRSMALTAPNPYSQANLILKAAKNANVDLGDIGYFETHGTGTKLGDPIEVQGITMAMKKYTDKLQFCPIGSVKANIGHLDCAAGIASVIKCLLQMQHKQIVPSIHYEIPNENIDFLDSPVYVNTVLRDWKVEEGKNRKCCISSFSVGGTNSHVILGEYQKESIPNEMNEKEIRILTLSAKKESVLRNLVENYVGLLNKENDINLDNMCYTANLFRDVYENRVAFVFHNKKDLLEKMHEFLYDSTPNRLDGVYRMDSVVGKVPNDVDHLLHKWKEEHYQVEEMAHQIAEAFVAGAKINWQICYEERNLEKISLPLYPFQKLRCWIDLEEDVAYHTMQQGESKKEFHYTLTGSENITKMEKDIGDCFYTLLGGETIDVRDSFFDLGGNSILAIKFEIEMRNRQYDFYYKDLMEYNSIQKIAQYLSKQPKKEEHIEVVQEEKENKESEIGNQVEPFNEIYFKDCFYNSFFPILIRNRKSIDCFMLNVYESYCLSDGLILSEYTSIQTFEELCNSQNIQYKAKESVEDVITSMEEAITQKQYVILFIDCFYETFRKDTYQKIHWPHTILIYDFDRENKKAKVIEHKNKDNLRYGHFELSYQDIKDSYEGYQKNYKDLFPYSFFSFDSTQDKEVAVTKEQLRSIASKNLEVALDSMNKGVELLNDFDSVFQEIIRNEAKFKEQEEKLMNQLNVILNIKNAELYKYERVEGFEEACKILNEIILVWNEIREAVCYCYYAKLYLADMLINQSEKIKKIVLLEKEYIAALQRGCL